MNIWISRGDAYFCLKRTASLFYNTFSALEDLTNCFSHYDKLITILCRNAYNGFRTWWFYWYTGLSTFITRAPTGFTLRKVTFEEVLKEINRLRSDSSTGCDQIPVKYIKLGKDHLAGPLMHIIDACIAASMFPHVWKTARVSPIPKIDQPIDRSDFRPVSILPALSKIYERLVLSHG